MARRRYKLDRVVVEPLEQRKARWRIRDEPSCKGVEHVYEVVDQNFPQRNRWEFVVRVPDVTNSSIEVRPLVVPNVRAWAGLDRRALMFARVTMGNYRGDCYCKVMLADPTRNKTKFSVRSEERAVLPYWFKPLQHRMRLKGAVRSTKGTDDGALVVTVAPNDHAAMIRLFLACKAWVLKEQFQLRNPAS